MFDNTHAASQKTVNTVFENQERKRRLWTVSETAEYLGVPESTIRHWIYHRVIPFRKAGKNVRFSPEEVEAWTFPKKGE